MTKRTLILEDAILRTCSLFGKTMNPSAKTVTKAIFRVILVTFISVYIVYMIRLNCIQTDYFMPSYHEYQRS